MPISKEDFLNLCETRMINPSEALENDQVKEAIRGQNYDELINALDSQF